MSSNWQDSLMSLLNSGTLPQGEDNTVPEQDEPQSARQKGKLAVSIEKKGRSGKIATIISGFTIDNDQLESLAKTLKSTLGTGGSARGGEILIQGDRRQDVKKLLNSLGYAVC